MLHAVHLSGVHRLRDARERVRLAKLHLQAVDKCAPRHEADIATAKAALAAAKEDKCKAEHEEEGLRVGTCKPRSTRCIPDAHACFHRQLWPIKSACLDFRYSMPGKTWNVDVGICSMPHRRRKAKRRSRFERRKLASTGHVQLTVSLSRNRSACRVSCLTLDWCAWSPMSRSSRSLDASRSTHA